MPLAQHLALAPVVGGSAGENGDGGLDERALMLLGEVLDLVVHDCGPFGCLIIGHVIYTRQKQ